MSINKATIARPYAKAIFAEAKQRQCITEWGSMLEIAATAVRMQEVTLWLKNPQVTPEQKTQFFIELCGVDKEEYPKNFIKQLTEKRRLLLLPEIEELYEKYRVALAQTKHVQVTSPYPLSTEQRQQLIENLKKRLLCDVILECKLDSELIGGVLIQADDLIIDGTVKGKLERLSKKLIEQ